jgi:hypothetical protein
MPWLIATALSAVAAIAAALVVVWFAVGASIREAERPRNRP